LPLNRTYETALPFRATPHFADRIGTPGFEPGTGEPMNGIIGEFRLGEDLAIALDAATGDTAQVTGVTAWMKPAEVFANRLVLDHDTPGVALQVTARGDAGWTLSLNGAATAALAPGIYGIDARLNLTDAVEITEQTAFVALSKAAVA
jgi:hypothetical protein